MKILSKSETPKNLMAAYFKTQDGHGGRGAEHRDEMEEIAKQVFASEKEKFIEEIKVIIYEESRRAYEQAIKEFLGELRYDIESIVKIGFDGCRDIFEDKKAQKYISDHIMQEITKRLNDKNFRK